MVQFEATVKKWGNSVGIVIPREIVGEEDLTPGQKVSIIMPTKTIGELLAGSPKLKRTKPMQQIMDEIDEGYD